MSPMYDKIKKKGGGIQIPVDFFLSFSHSHINIILQGAQDILNELPVEFVEPLVLKDVSETGGMKLDIHSHL